MKSHLTIEANGKELSLPKDFKLDIEDANPLFNDNEMYTFPVSIPLEGNRHLVENVEDIHADISPLSLEHLFMRIKVDGIPYRSGVSVVDDSQEMKDHFSFSIQSMKESLENQISDLDCRDIPVADDIQIGEMIGDVDVDWYYDYRLKYIMKTFSPLAFTLDWRGDPLHGEAHHKVSLPALGFSFPYETKENANMEAERTEDGPTKQKNFINVSDPYPVQKYCNTRVCYKNREKDENGSSVQKDSAEGKYGPFFVLDADRPQSGICFYVLYFLECLFRHLQISYDLSQLLKVEDLTRLFFFNTSCKYRLIRKYTDKLPKTKDLHSVKEINDWITTRAVDPDKKGTLDFVTIKERDFESLVIDGKLWIKGEELVETVEGGGGLVHKRDTLLRAWSVLWNNYYSVEANVMKMLATSDNFPDESVSTVLDSLFNSFGVKFIVNQETRSVKAVLLRDIFRSTMAPLDFPCEVISVVKIVEKVTGVEMTYSAESDKKDQERNIKYGVKDYDTNFDYIDYSNVDQTLSYEQILKKRSNSDQTTYVDRNTGNAYRLKVDSEAESVSSLNARIFEVGGYKGVSIGDCSTVNKDYVQHFNIDWTPMLFTDVNLTQEMQVGSNNEVNCTDKDGRTVVIGGVNKASRDQIFAAFLEENMWGEHAEMDPIDISVSGDYCDAVLRVHLTTEEAYDPSSTEDGDSPLQHADWGCAVGIMRGGGADATLQEYDSNYDGFGSSKWRMVSGSYDVSSDSIDNWGNGYDYNGDDPGIGGGDRISLKIRSYHEDKNGQPMVVDQPEVRLRGLYDSFMSEYTHFLLHRNKYKITCICEISALADVPNHWERRFRIGNLVGWINKINSSVSSEEGLGLVEIELYSL